MTRCSMRRDRFGEPYLVMEYIEGSRSIATATARLDVRRACACSPSWRRRAFAHRNLSCTATSSRRTSSSRPRAAPGGDFGTASCAGHRIAWPRPRARRSHRPMRAGTARRPRRRHGQRQFSLGLVLRAAHRRPAFGERASLMASVERARAEHHRRAQAVVTEAAAQSRQTSPNARGGVAATSHDRRQGAGARPEQRYAASSPGDDLQLWAEGSRSSPVPTRELCLRKLSAAASSRRRPSSSPRRARRRLRPRSSRARADARADAPRRWSAS